MKNNSQKAKTNKIKRATSAGSKRATSVKSRKVAPATGTSKTTRATKTIKAIKTAKATKINRTTEPKQSNLKSILIQVGLAVYFTIYFIAHHFLGFLNTRWILYAGIALIVLLAIKIRHDAKIKNMKVENFAEGFSFYKVFLIYVIGCIIGTFYEEIAFTLIEKGSLSSRQGLIYGPFNPVYGAGFLAFTVLLCRNLKRKWYLTYIYSCLIGGATETVSSLIGEYVFKANAWDYSGKILNIMGRTTIPYMLFWGLGGLVFVKLVYPALSRFIELLPKKIGNAIMPTFIIFVVLSHVVSYTALFRYGTRAEGEPARNDFETFLDKYWDDDMMKQYYDNPEHKKIGE